MLLLALSVTGVAGGRAAPAEAEPEAEAAPYRVEGIVFRTAGTDFSSVDVKETTAMCPAGKQVIGGGAEVRASGSNVAIRRRVALTQLEPFRDSGGYGYKATAAEMHPGTTGVWSITAVAVCADPVPGYHRVLGRTDYTSDTVHRVSAPCPDDEVALGTGARINWPLDVESPGSGLQVARADALGVIGRAQSHEQAAGYPHETQLLAFAVCADRPDGFQVLMEPSDEADSETEKFAGVGCPGTDRLTHSGAAVSNTASGNVTLNSVRPFHRFGAPDHLRLSNAYAYENNPTEEDWDFIVAQAICVE